MPNGGRQEKGQIKRLVSRVRRVRRRSVLAVVVEFFGW